MKQPKTQLERVIAISLMMRRPMCLDEFARQIKISFGTTDTPAAISARLREVEKHPKTKGHYSMRKTHQGGQTWLYQVLGEREQLLQSKIAPSHTHFPGEDSMTPQELAASLIEAKLRKAVSGEAIKARVDAINDTDRREAVIRYIRSIKDMVNATGPARWLQFRAQQQGAA